MGRMFGEFHSIISGVIHPERMRLLAIFWGVV
jgi:hypothetical protein